MDIRRRFLSKKSSGGSSGGDSSGTYTVNLNSQWEKTTAVTNPDSSLYDGVYRSASNYNVNSGVATMYITLTGYSTFKLYIRSYAESSYDYVMVSQLDKTITGSSSYSDTTLVKAHTCGNQQSGTALSSYTLVEYTSISSGSHTITIVYKKDGSVNSGDDRGYVLIPKSQESGGDSGGGDVDIDTTYSIMYTSSDGNVVTPYSTTVFGANITSNTYVNGQGIITFDGPVTSIGDYAFRSRTGLKSITIPNSATEIGYSAFNSCTGLTSITIPNSVTLIDGYAFNGCTSITSITIGNSVTSIGNYAFNGCGGELITQSNIPSSSSSQGSKLYGSKFTKIIFGDDVTSIGTYSISDSTSLTNVTIGNSVTSIGRYAFKGCTSLTNVTIGNSVAKIESSAFRECSGLTSITIPNSVTEIGDYAFDDCSNLTNITIGSGIEQIGMFAFDCPNIDKLYCKALVPPKLYYSSSFPDNLSIKKV